MRVGTSYVRHRVGDTWDAIVIGSGIGGLTAAGFLAREGKDVLVLERHIAAGGCTQVFRRAGYESDVGVHYLGDVHRPGTYLRLIFDHVSAGALQWAPMSDVYNRVVIGDREYEFPTGLAAFSERLKEYFPREARAIDTYLDMVLQVALSAKSFFAHRALPPPAADCAYEQMCAPFLAFSDRTALEVLSGLTSDRELIAVLCGHFGDYSLTPGRVSFAMHALLVRHYLDGAYYPVGGSGRIGSTVADVIRAAGGDILIGADVESVLVGRDQVAYGVRMADGRTFHAPVVVSDAGIANTVNHLIPPDIVERSGLADDCAAMEPSLPWVVLNIGVRESAETLGFDRSNVWVHPGADMDAQVAAYEADPGREPMPLCMLSFPSAKDPSWDRRYPGRSTITVAGLTTWSLFEPFAGTRWMRRGAAYDALKQRLTDELLGQLLRFCPQVAGKVDHLELATPLSFNHFLGRETGDFMSFAHTPRRFRQRWINAHSPVPGLFFTGQDVVTGGIGGAAMGGAIAASAVLGRDVLRRLSALSRR